MKPASFKYSDPATMDEALQLLDQYGDEARLLAGGQSLVPMLNMRLVRPGVLIDANRIASLDYVKEGDDGELRIGAMTRLATLERSELVARKWPLLREAIRHVGHSAIRFRGTAGGSIAHADPSAELPGVAAALDAEFVIRSSSGERTVTPEEFFLGYMMTSLEPTEMLVEIRFPAVPEGTGSAFLEVARRKGDFALVGVAAALGLGDDGQVSYARLSVIGAGPAAERLADAESILLGERPTDELFRAAAASARETVAPDDDLHATAEYRQELVDVLTRRALAAALERCAAA